MRKIINFYLVHRLRLRLELGTCEPICYKMGAHLSDMRKCRLKIEHQLEYLRIDYELNTNLKP